MKPREEKALAACIESVAAAKQIKQLKVAIGDALGTCFDEYRKNANGENPMSWKSHLEMAYSFDIIDPDDFDDESDTGRIYLSDKDQLIVLAARPYCLTAHFAIQSRKQARKRLGNARRAITRIGGTT